MIHGESLKHFSNYILEWKNGFMIQMIKLRARPEIAKILSSLKTFFPRLDNTNGYNLPKMHLMTKFVGYMMLYGSAMKFYGGPG